ncbi:uncharacterized protein LOC116286240 isoform X2 [Actinia tenebrosa]|nr:uncharacterized protein LOC116286240 isoform X2 [Actinia tenebrosa]
MTAPFILLTMLVGLWPVCRYKVFQKFFMVIGVAINTYVFIGNIAVYRFCAVITPNAANELSPFLCYGMMAFNETSKQWAKIFRPVLFSRALFSFAQFSGYILIAHCILGKLPKQKKAVPLKLAYNLLTRKQWIKLNFQILLSFSIWITFLVSDLRHAEKYIPKDHFVIWLKIENLVVWFYVGAPLWIFAVMISALESLITACIHEIKELREGDINEVISIYQELCNHIFSTVRGLKFWFVIHWFAFGMAFIVDVALGFKSVDSLPNQQNEFQFWVFHIAFLAFALYPFLYPSICAASLTSKCGNMLEQLNFISSTAWRPGHPLKIRSNMNEFLIFANQTHCGFRIGRLTFNNGLAWISICFGIFGMVFKLL